MYGSGSEWGDLRYFVSREIKGVVVNAEDNDGD
jgi:hypothetical protein